MKRASLLALLLVTTALPTALKAQPMIDPAKMSGIPRPDPQVPAGTITVRLIRGELSNRVVGSEVALADAGGKVVKAKTDENGRATFGGLKGPGPFVATAVEGGEQLNSQPIELPADVGVRVMLVFKATGAAGEASADGAARPDKSIPAGTIIVRAIGEGGTPQSGLDVIVGHMRAGEQGVRELRAKTDAKGEAHFGGLDAKPTSGYLAEVVKDGARFPGKPFRLTENMGAEVVIDVRPVSKDTSALHIANGSHVIVEVRDDAVELIEIWRLTNNSSNAIDPGPNGLHLSLPDKALSAQVGPQSPPNFSIMGHEAVWRGAIPPGTTDLQVAFVLVYHGEGLDITQRTPVALDDFAMVTEKLEGFTIEGNQLQSEDRPLQGRMLVLVRGPGSAAGGEWTVHLHGLPHADPTWRLAAAAVSVLLLIGFGIAAARGNQSTAQARHKLEEQRERLLQELLAFDAKDADGQPGPYRDQRAQKRAELTAKLAKVYRELDEVTR
jgi:hypothetical protein